MIQFVPRKIQSNFWTVLSPIISITITILIGSLIFKILNYPVLESLYQVFISPFSRPDRIADIFVKACPLIIIGLGLIFCFRANIWNIGAEGQFIFGTLCAGSFALLFPENNSYSILFLMFIIGFIGVLIVSRPGTIHFSISYLGLFISALLMAVNISLVIQVLLTKKL